MRIEFSKGERASKQDAEKSLFSPAHPGAPKRILHQASFSLRPETQRGGKEAHRKSEALNGFIPSPRSMCIGEWPHEVRLVPSRLFARCGLAWDKARLGALGLGGCEVWPF
jgi:hypothetical protein